MFGSTINYEEVVVHEDKAYFFQPSDIAITPNGQISFPKESYKDDFSTNPYDMAWLIHEMTHVWQKQQRMWVRTRGMFVRNYDYGDPSKQNLIFLGSKPNQPVEAGEVF